MDAPSLRDRAEKGLARSRAAVTRFLSLDPSTDYATAVATLDGILRPLNGIEGRIQLFAKVHPDPAIRDAALAIEQELAGWNTELSLHRGIYDHLVRLESQPPSGADEARVVELVLRTLRHAGIDRDAATRKRVKELRDEIVRIGQEFDGNIITGGRDFRIAEGHAGLAGLPEDFLRAHPEAEDGSVTLSTDLPDRVPFLTFATRRDLRQCYYHEVMNRAAPQNLGVLARLLARRHELATLLGHAHWADYVTEDKMVRSAEEAGAFLARITEVARQAAQGDYAELLAAKRHDDPPASVVHEWERAYLTEQIRRRRFRFDSQSVRPYFPYRAVRDGVLRTTAALFGVELRRQEAVDVWHPSVEVHDVLEGGVTIARFYLDMHPREGKYKHGAMFDMTAGVLGAALPEACLVCNFPEPRDGDDALMLRSEVSTFFHEFGHLFHHLFARQRYVRIAGITCEWDFVEVPSQIYEEWAWDYGVLSSFALHHRSGEPIPRELVARMREAEEHGRALQTLTQAYLAQLSLDCYRHDPAGFDPLAHMIELKERLLPFPHEAGTCFIASFGHLHGYSAMYYTYLWSLVIAKDLLSRFGDDVMNPAVAAEYRHKILARGGSRDAREMVRDFLGREPAFAAFERWLQNPPSQPAE